MLLILDQNNVLDNDLEMATDDDVTEGVGWVQPSVYF
jgi:hypothetical protein